MRHERKAGAQHEGGTRKPNEDPPRTRVDEFPNTAEPAELQKNVV